MRILCIYILCHDGTFMWRFNGWQHSVLKTCQWLYWEDLVGLTLRGHCSRSDSKQLGIQSREPNLSLLYKSAGNSIALEPLVGPGLIELDKTPKQKTENSSQTNFPPPSPHHTLHPCRLTPQWGCQTPGPLVHWSPSTIISSISVRMNQTVF